MMILKLIDSGHSAYDNDMHAQYMMGLASRTRLEAGKANESNMIISPLNNQYLTPHNLRTISCTQAARQESFWCPHPKIVDEVRGGALFRTGTLHPPPPLLGYCRGIASWRSDSMAA